MTSKEIINAVLAITILVIIIGVLRYSKFFNLFAMENLKNLKNQIESYGLLGQLIYISINILAGLISFPVVIIKFMGGLIYGPILGTILTIIGSTFGTFLSFLISRHGFKDLFVKMIDRKRSLKKIYNGFEKNGWKMIMISRLIPVFPYSLQNYVYGVTDIKLTRYIFTTFIFMLPSNFGICYLASVVSNDGSILMAVSIYIGIAILFGVAGLLISLKR